MYDPDTEEREKAIALWKSWIATRVDLIAPSLLRYEVTNAVFRPVRLNRADPDRAIGVLKSIDRLPIEYVDSFNLNLAAFEIAQTLKLNAAYDAHYVALARQENAHLYTADKRLAIAAAMRFPFVTYLMDEAEPPT
jgi:predicted nucleic acid-binding protein